MIRGLLSDQEWTFFASFVLEIGPLRGRPPRDHRRTLDTIFWIARTVERLGETFPMHSAIGTPCIGKTAVGPPVGCGT